MKVTRTQIYPVLDSKTNFKGFAQVTLNDSLKLTGLKIFENEYNQLQVHYPRNPKSKKSLCYMFPIDPELKNLIEESVITAFNNYE